MICRRYKTFEEADLHVKVRFTAYLHRKLSYASAGMWYHFFTIQQELYRAIFDEEVKHKYGSCYQ